ncbi:hypothetical protein P3G55_14445 [Leptospira sp. 96542]|nr:hypothetical protein [Leptospira sp. 96542]
MNLNLNESEVKHLLQALSIYEWVSNSPHEEADSAVEEFCQSVLKKLQTLGVKEPITSDDGVLTVDETFFQEVFESYIEPYNDDVFWSDLSTELAQRDLEEKHSPKELEALSPDEYEAKVTKIAETYDKEFETNGVDKLFLKK